ncbi:MAG: hypothetical protein GY928_03975, partial [Colwellia sp.]|nr:hypothetical protein [Colwellia sp.]
MAAPKRQKRSFEEAKPETDFDNELMHGSVPMPSTDVINIEFIKNKIAKKEKKLFKYQRIGMDPWKELNNRERVVNENKVEQLESGIESWKQRLAQAQEASERESNLKTKNDVQAESEVQIESNKDKIIINTSQITSETSPIHSQSSPVQSHLSKAQTNISFSETKVIETDENEQKYTNSYQIELLADALVDIEQDTPNCRKAKAQSEGNDAASDIDIEHYYFANKLYYYEYIIRSEYDLLVCNDCLCILCPRNITERDRHNTECRVCERKGRVKIFEYIENDTNVQILRATDVQNSYYKVDGGQYTKDLMNMLEWRKVMGMWPEASNRYWRIFPAKKLQFNAAQIRINRLRNACEKAKFDQIFKDKYENGPKGYMTERMRSLDQYYAQQSGTQAHKPIQSANKPRQSGPNPSKSGMDTDAK